MKSPFKILSKDPNSKARCGVLYTKHGAVHTPVFMPVATQACVKALTDEDLRNAGAECLLSNTYHLYLRPSTQILQTMGGLHKFMNWDRSILTDSGGFQVYSLSKFRKIKEEGVTFQSHHDGSKHLFTPENVIQFESEIGSDIWTMLDVCIHAKDPAKYDARQALEQTKRWAVRAAAHLPPSPHRAASKKRNKGKGMPVWPSRSCIFSRSAYSPSPSHIVR